MSVLNVTYVYYSLIVHVQPSLNVTNFHECTNHTLSETPSPPHQKSTHQHENPHENNKNQAKKLKVYRTNIDFHRMIYEWCVYDSATENSNCTKCVTELK